MTYKEAREAGAHAICDFIRGGCLKCPFNNDPAHAITKGCQAIASQAVDAALSAFSAAGYEVVPREASDAMVRAATDSGITDPDGWATSAYEIEQLWPLIITAALKECT